ncbi:MAG TPA: mersacidin/lichenicidin family type 2 lantibiotic [Archangium sp.]|uniref:mersacidin/lichenicidin family type 2 lantibiotic n=1 Tax=Archangium sp. TaxID=1872627 RepID=UPI002E2F495B|nr:mersacidin/lichenicidin family type 2 lantibiotic [Archangium sp.]HEX5751948.1 mersacidin/lichenicidin family type 2 lantibiotic [Archangium sp.]
MDTKRIIRAWKEPDYRATLTAEERSALPESPSGKPLTEFEEDALRGVVGGKPFPNPSVLDDFNCTGFCSVLTCDFTLTFGGH